MKIHTLLLLIIFALFSSCTDDLIDEEGPSITIHSPEDLTVLLRNRVNFKIEAFDNATVSKIEFFVDGSLLQSADGAEMQVFWDTQRIEDGSHTVRIVAEDIAGNQGERSIQVEVKNDLFTFRIGANYIRGGEEVWIFVSDSVGNPVGVKRVLTNIDVVKINTPEGHKSSMQYTVNFLNYANAAEISGTKENFIFTSYVNLSSMDFMLDNEIRAQPTSPIGKHNLIVHSSPTYPPKRGVLGADAFIAGFEGTLPALGRLVFPISAALTKSPSDVMYFIHENDKPTPKFIRFPAATAGDSEIVEYSALEEMRSSSITLPEIANYSYFAIATVSKKDDFVNFRPFIDQANLQSSVLVTMFLPEVEFPDYLTGIGYSTDNSNNSYLVAGLYQPSISRLMPI